MNTVEELVIRLELTNLLNTGADDASDDVSFAKVGSVAVDLNEAESMVREVGFEPLRLSAGENVPVSRRRRTKIDPVHRAILVHQFSMVQGDSSPAVTSEPHPNPSCEILAKVDDV
jgi:hypothetical protein